MTILGIEQITYGVTALNKCRRFMQDWGLREVFSNKKRCSFETLNGSRIVLALYNDPTLPSPIEKGSTVREVVWGVTDLTQFNLVAKRMCSRPSFFYNNLTIGCVDPNGLLVRVEITRKRHTDIFGSLPNVWGHRPMRVNIPSPIYNRAYPIGIGHIVFFTNKLTESEIFYRDVLGFEISDRYVEIGTFMRCVPDGRHHDIFFLKNPNRKCGLNHVAFIVRDIHEVFGGGLYVDRHGWKTQVGPGRHPVSSAYFWYFFNPAGALIEYYSDEDQLTSAWKPRELEYSHSSFNEWGIEGGINGFTRKQRCCSTKKDIN